MVSSPRSATARYAARCTGPSMRASCQAVIPSAWKAAWARRIPASHSSGVVSGSRSPDEVLRLLVERALRLAGGVALDPAAGGIAGLGGHARELERAAVDPGAVAVAVLEEGRPVGEDRVEVGPARRPVLEGVDRPAGALDPLELGVLGRVARRSSPGRPRACARRGGRSLSSSTPPSAGWQCASWKAGRTVRPSRSRTRVAGPTCAIASAAGPTQAMRPSRTATASATVSAASAVKTLPPGEDEIHAARP